MHKLLVCFIFCAQIALNTDAVEPDYYWRDYLACNLPSDAVELPRDIYIGQVNYEGNIPALIYHYRGLALADIGGMRIVRNNIKILCSSNSRKLYWDTVNFGDDDLPYSQTRNAVKVGYDENLNDSLFLGKIYFEDKWRYGKVVPMEYDKKGLYIRDNSGDVRLSLSFNILKCNTTVFN